MYRNRGITSVAYTTHRQVPSHPRIRVCGTVWRVHNRMQQALEQRCESGLATCDPVGRIQGCSTAVGVDCILSERWTVAFVLDSVGVLGGDLPNGNLRRLLKRNRNRKHTVCYHGVGLTG